MTGILVVTIIYAVFAGLQWDTMSKQLALTDRPWLKVGLEIVAPIQFIKFPEKTMIRTSVCMRIKNIGRSVATNIRSDCKISLARVFNTNYRFDELKEQQGLFNELMTNKVHPLDEGECIFPDDERVLIKNIDYFIKDNDFINIPNFEEIEGRKFFIGYLYPLLVISCVDYQFDPSSQHHQTGIIGRIIQTTQHPVGTPDNIINGARAIKVGDEIPISELKIIPYASGGRKAN